MSASVRDLIDPISLEYAQGQIAFLAGECYETCPHEPARKGLSRERTNWFQGYWDERAKALAAARKSVKTPIQLTITRYDSDYPPLPS